MPSQRLRRTLLEPRPGSRTGQPVSVPQARPPGAEDGLQLTSRLGGGAVTEVWRALTPAGRSVAIKLPLAELAGHAGAVRLVEREWRHLQTLSHPGLIEPLALITTERGPGLVSEYLGGGDLVSLCGSHPRHWARAARQMVSALEYLHGRGIVHRDIKPRNVLFDHHGDAKLIDLALAEPSGSVARIGGGTHAYQSAGQRRGVPVRAADDTHAFAAVIYELLGGRLPFGPEPTLADLEIEPEPPLNFMPAHASGPAQAALSACVHAVLTAPGCDAGEALAAIGRRLDAIIEAHG